MSLSYDAAFRPEEKPVNNGRCPSCGQKKRRSIPQNSISHAWYQDIAKVLREDDALGWKCYCKLHHGIPILRAEDEEFKYIYDNSIKGMTYEQKLMAMKFLPVTSLMNKDQLSKYLECVQVDFAKRGVSLEFPNEGGE